MRDELEEARVLHREPVVEDAQLRAEAMRARVDERCELEVLVRAELFAVEVERVEHGAAVGERVTERAQPHADARLVAMEQRVAPQRRVIRAPLLERGEDRRVARAIAQPPRRAFEIDRREVRAVEERDDLRERAVLRQVRPRRRIRGLAAGGDFDIARRRRGDDLDDLSLAADVHREVREPPGRREVERVFVAVRAVRREQHVDRRGRATVRDRDRAARNLHERRDALPRAGRIREHDLARVDDAGRERAGDVLRDLLAVFVAVAIVAAHVALPDDERRAGCDELAVDDLRRAGERVAGGGDRQARSVRDDHVRRCDERQVGDGERAHRLGEIARREAEPRRQERRRAPLR